MVVEAILDKKGEDVVVLDVREVASFADTFVIASGTSDRHVKSLVDSVEQALRARGERPLGIEGYRDARWVLVDCDDVIVHVFLRDVREHFDLERLWSDAPTLELGGDDARSAAR